MLLPLTMVRLISRQAEFEKMIHGLTKALKSKASSTYQHTFKRNFSFILIGLFFYLFVFKGQFFFLAGEIKAVVHF